jgi:hypothetical protein
MEESTLVKQSFEIGTPKDVNAFGVILKKYIEDNKLSVNIQNKQYVYADGWKFAGISFGFTHICSKPLNESVDGEIKYSCEADIINVTTDKKIGYGWAICSNKESKKKSFDEYAIASMAQTRAIGKAYRNLLGFIMNSAGYQSTPAEEMDEPKYSKPSNTQELHPSEIHEIVEGIKATKSISDLEVIWNALSHVESKNTEILEAGKAQKQSLKSA